MKKLLNAASVLTLLLAANFAQAQSKVGYIAFNEVVQLMPEYKTIQTQMTEYQKQWTDQLQAIRDEGEKKVKEYQAGEKTMSDAIKVSKQAELQDIDKRYQDLNTKFQQAVEAKAAEYSKPVLEKVRSAVNAVAKEKGYSYVINSNETDLLVAPDADNLMAPVKIKLSIK